MLQEGPCATRGHDRPCLCPCPCLCRCPALLCVWTRSGWRTLWAGRAVCGWAKDARLAKACERQSPCLWNLALMLQSGSLTGQSARDYLLLVASSCRRLPPCCWCPSVAASLASAATAVMNYPMQATAARTATASSAWASPPRPNRNHQATKSQTTCTTRESTVSYTASHTLGVHKLSSQHFAFASHFDCLLLCTFDAILQITFVITYENRYNQHLVVDCR